MVASTRHSPQASCISMLLVLTASLCVSVPANAAQLKATRLDERDEKIIASTNVEVVQQEQLLLCERLEYQPKTGKVEAIGNVTLVSPEGWTTFHDRLELTGSLKRGVIEALNSRTGVETVPSREQPLLLEASRIDYDHDARVVTASERVEVAQGGNILLSDRLIYDQNSGKVYAQGNVSLLEETGHVLFAEKLELKDDMKSGVIRQFRARFNDNSLFAAAQARRIDENNLSLYKAVYSPCRVTCDVNNPKAPMWQLKAQHVDIDQANHSVEYENAFFEVFGLPLIYTPYFSHATPDAPNTSGLLTPEYKDTGNLGTVLKLPVYLALAQDYDITLTPMLTSQAGQVLQADYRQKFDDGELRVTGSGTDAPDIDTLGNRAPGNAFRGHIKADGEFAIDETYRWGFNLYRASDDTYLRRYRFGSETLLTSKAYVEGQHFDGTNDRSYGAVEALSFQGLTATDRQATIPIIAPKITAHLQSDPGIFNSRWLLDIGTSSLFREEGTDSQRLSTSVGWVVPYVTQGGHVFEFSSQLRNDLYSVADLTLENGQSFEGSTGRIVPEVSALWRFPLINQFESGRSILVEPVAKFTLSPNGGNSAEIPNEDSRVPEFTESNLFSANRYAGYDRIETGPRMSYGVRTQSEIIENGFVDGVFGQHYRVNDDRNFPISNDVTDRFSDYVGRVGFGYDIAQIDYRFRLDKETFSPKRSEVTTGLALDPIYLSTTYLLLDNDPVFADREQVSGALTIKLTDQWQWNVGGSTDLNNNVDVGATTGLIFQNECTMLSLQAARNFTRDRDVRPETSISFIYALKNLE